MGSPLELGNKFNELIDDSKSILVKRSVEGILATISNRSPREGDYRSKFGYSKSFLDRIKNSEVEKIMSYYNQYDKLETKFPDKFLSIELKELMNNTEAEMKNIANFLNINFENILTIGSRDGKELVCKGQKYVGEIYDAPSKLLSPKEIKIIERHKKLFELHKIKVNIFSKDLLT